MEAISAPSFSFFTKEQGDEVSPVPREVSAPSLAGACPGAQGGAVLPPCS